MSDRKVQGSGPSVMRLSTPYLPLAEQLSITLCITDLLGMWKMQNDSLKHLNPKNRQTTEMISSI